MRGEYCASCENILSQSMMNNSFKADSLTLPLITIGMTCFNAVDTIEDAVTSALVQTWENIEILIVDDCSTDDSVSVLKKIEKEHPQLRLICQRENKGVAASRNALIRQAAGAFIAFFDDDDKSAPDRLQKQYDRIVSYERHYAHGAPVICHTARTQRYPDGTARYETTMGTASGIAPGGVAVALRILTGRPVPHVFGSTATCSQMARTETYRDLEGFDEGFRRSEDTDFNVRAAIKGAHFAGIEEPLVIQTMTRASDKTLEEEAVCALRLLEKHEAFIREHTSFSFCYRWLEEKQKFLKGHKGAFLCGMLCLLLRHPVLTVQRLMWAAPNIGFNFKTKQFHDNKE